MGNDVGGFHGTLRVVEPRDFIQTQSYVFGAMLRNRLPNRTYCSCVVLRTDGTNKADEFLFRQGVNHSNSSAVARICNAALDKKTQFYVPDRVQHHAGGVAPAQAAFEANRAKIM